MIKKLHPKQYEVATDEHRYRVICAGRRSGKSVLSRFIVLKWATEEKGLYWVVSPTYKQSKQIHWREINNEVPQEWVRKKNEVELSITLKNGSIIELKGAENPDALRGVKLRGLVIDEIASIRNWNWLWAEVLRPTLTDYEAPAIFISTPKGFNHFYELYQKGQEDKTNYKSWKFTSYENPYIPKGDIDNARLDLTDDTFQQEYMADFRKYTGLVYKEFERPLHLISQFDIPDTWTIVRGFDFGSTNPTVCLWVALDPDGNYFIIDEHYETGKTVDYHAGVVNANRYSQRVEQSYGDPSGAQWITEFAQRGVYITAATRESSTSAASWVRLGIERIRTYLRPIPGHFVSGLPESYKADKRGMPKMFVFEHCTNTIRELEQYRWKERQVTQAQDLNEPDVPEKANDHAMDALRYIMTSYVQFKGEERNDFGTYKNIW